MTISHDASILLTLAEKDGYTVKEDLYDFAQGRPYEAFARGLKTAIQALPSDIDKDDREDIKNRVSMLNLDELKHWWQSNRNLFELEVHFKLTSVTLRKIAKEHGFGDRKRVHKGDMTISTEQMIEAFKQTGSFKLAARTLGIFPSTLERSIKRKLKLWDINKIKERLGML